MWETNSEGKQFFVCCGTLKQRRPNQLKMLMMTKQKTIESTICFKGQGGCGKGC